jgi:adenosylcobinamide-GDP ribazoletransferase
MTNKTKEFKDGIKYSISYFSTLPIKISKFEASDSFYKGVLFGLPLVGFLSALITIAIFLILPFPLIYKTILCSILYLFLNGFIHLEGVADTIDGYFSSFGKKDVYEVMKEPQVGAIGAIGTFCFVLLKVLAISYLLYYEQYFLIILAFTFSRASVFFALDLEFHNKSIFVQCLQNSIKVPLVFKLIFLPIDILTKATLRKLKKHLGFINGDTLGFNIEFMEIVLLNIAVLILA